MNEDRYAEMRGLLSSASRLIKEGDVNGLTRMYNDIILSLERSSNGCQYCKERIPLSNSGKYHWGGNLEIACDAYEVK